MNEKQVSSKPLGTRLIAVLILLVAAWVLLHFLIGIAVAIASVAAIVLAVAALVWAARVLL